MRSIWHTYASWRAWYAVAVHLRPTILCTGNPVRLVRDQETTGPYRYVTVAIGDYMSLEESQSIGSSKE